MESEQTMQFPVLGKTDEKAVAEAATALKDGEFGETLAALEAERNALLSALAETVEKLLWFDAKVGVAGYAERGTIEISLGSGRDGKLVLDWFAVNNAGCFDEPKLLFSLGVEPLASRVSLSDRSESKEKIVRAAEILTNDEFQKRLDEATCETVTKFHALIETSRIVSDERRRRRAEAEAEKRRSMKTYKFVFREIGDNWRYVDATDEIRASSENAAIWKFKIKHWTANPKNIKIETVDEKRKL